MNVPEKVLERYEAALEGDLSSESLHRDALEAALEQLRAELEDPKAVAHAPARLEEMAHFYEGDGEIAAKAVVSIVLDSVLGDES